MADAAQDTRLRLRDLVKNIKNNVLRAVEMPLEKAADLTRRHGTDLVTRALDRMHPTNPLRMEVYSEALPFLEEYVVRQLSDLPALVFAAQLLVLADTLLLLQQEVKHEYTSVVRAAEHIRKQVMPIALLDAMPSDILVDEYMHVLAAILHCAQAPTLRQPACAELHAHDELLCSSLVGVVATDLPTALQQLIMCMYVVEHINFAEFKDQDADLVWSPSALGFELSKTIDGTVNSIDARKFANKFAYTMVSAYRSISECRESWRLASSRPPDEGGGGGAAAANEEGGGRKRKR